MAHYPYQIFILLLSVIIYTALPAPLRPASQQSEPLALSVDAAADRKPISPYIYGMNYASEALADELRLPVRRWGGNATSRYNWQLSMTNTGSDWYFENVPEGTVNPANLPDGSASDQFIEQDRRTATATLLTIPMIGWTVRRRQVVHPYDCGFKVSQYGSQQEVDQDYDADCGNGRYPDGSTVTGNDPADTSQAITPTFVAAWIEHLTEKYGIASQGGVRFYALDNEPMLWDDTHRDVHPQPTSYDEMRQLTEAYAATIKAADPSARTLGPVLFGWTAYWYSALDWSPGGSWWDNPQDRNAHGGVAFVPWYLQQMKAYEQQHNQRILDYLDLHYYPQAPGVSLAPVGNANTQSLRLRSTRSLWDPTYADESWIADTEGGPAVRLIPRMREWVQQNYPGTSLAISEYNWGGLEHINGALAQADVLGIFGREGLDLATLWDPPAANQPGAYAFRIYRNYDAAGSAFGETSLRALSTDQARLSIYAAQRTADNCLTIIVINKTGSALNSTLTVANFNAASTAQIYRYSAANLNSIQHLADLPVASGAISASYPAESISLLVIHPAGALADRIYLPLILR